MKRRRKIPAKKGQKKYSVEFHVESFAIEPVSKCTKHNSDGSKTSLNHSNRCARAPHKQPTINKQSLSFMRDSNKLRRTYIEDLRVNYNGKTTNATLVDIKCDHKWALCAHTATKQKLK